MVCILSNTAVRVNGDSHSLIFNAAHRLSLAGPGPDPGPDPDPDNSKARRLPEALDVRPASTLVFSFAGVLDRAPVEPERLRSSSVVAHFVAFITRNANELGVANVSNVYTDEEDGKPKCISLSSAHPPLPDSSNPHATLTAIDLTYVWKSTAPLSDSAHPFSSQPLLPFEESLSVAVNKFTTFHLVRRYPLIFGPWRTKLDTEVQFFPSLASSLLNIVARSPNQAFRKKCRKILRTLKNQNASILEAKMSTVADYMRSSSNIEFQPTPNDVSNRDDADTLKSLLETLFKATVRPTLFKGSCADRKSRDEINSADEFDFSQQSQSSSRDVDPASAEQVVSPWDNPFANLGPGDAHMDVFQDEKNGQEDNVNLGHDQTQEHDFDLDLEDDHGWPVDNMQNDNIFSDCSDEHLWRLDEPLNMSDSLDGHTPPAPSADSFGEDVPVMLDSDSDISVVPDLAFDFEPTTMPIWSGLQPPPSSSSPPPMTPLGRSCDEDLVLALSRFPPDSDVDRTNQNQVPSVGECIDFGESLEHEDERTDPMDWDDASSSCFGRRFSSCGDLDEHGRDPASSVGSLASGADLDLALDLDSDECVLDFDVDGVEDVQAQAPDAVLSQSPLSFLESNDANALYSPPNWFAQAQNWSYEPRQQLEFGFEFGRTHDDHDQELLPLIPSRWDQEEEDERVLDSDLQRNQLRDGPVVEGTARYDEEENMVLEFE